MDTTKEPDRIDYEPLRVLMEEIPVALVNRVARERGHSLAGVHPALPEFLRLTLQISTVTWDTIKKLCGDKVLKDDRDLQLAISVPPLARTILDSLFTFIYVFDDPIANMRWFLASGWREVDAYHAMLLGRHSADPEWTEWLKLLAEDRDRLERQAAITSEEKKKPTTIRYWPNPGKMGGKKSQVRAKEPARADFLLYLSDWFYSHLSGDSHLSFMGLVRRGGRLLDKDDLEASRFRLTLYRSEVVFNALTIFLALLSEVTGQLKLAHEAERLRLAWEHLRKWPDAQELHDVRYQACLNW